MTRLEIINYLISQHNLKSYLEIGVSYGEVLNGCIAEYKKGVDPNAGIYRGGYEVYKGTSDEFFTQLADDIKFDLIFIDGLHESEQVITDITNSLKHISPYGYIVLHDCNPPTKWHVRPYADFLKDTNTNWNGTVYKGYIEAVVRYGLDYNTVNDDWGVGIIQPIRTTAEIPGYGFTSNWEYFDKNRERLLNLITVEDFKTLYK